MTNPTRSLKRKHVPCEIRYDGCNHGPVQVEGCAQLCKAEMCTRKTRFYCNKFVLCMTGSTCVFTFHGVNL